MKKILIIMVLAFFTLGAGCTIARKPAPEPEPKPLVVPETSKVGFSPVDLNKAPDLIKNIASDISKRETATWAQVNGTSYILVSSGEQAGSKAEIVDVTQKIPAQNFVWIDVKAKYISRDNADKSGPVTVIALNLNDKTINGVGFEVAKTAAAAPSPSPAPVSPAPAPAPKTTVPSAPAPAKKTTPEPPAKTEQPKESTPGQGASP